MSLRIRRWPTTVNPRISLLDYGFNRSISAGATAGKRNVRKAFADTRGKARGKSLGLVSLYIRARLKSTGLRFLVGLWAKILLRLRRACTHLSPITITRSPGLLLIERTEISLADELTSLCRNTSSWLSGDAFSQRRRKHIDEQHLPGPAEPTVTWAS